MEGDRVEGERSSPREVDVHARWKPDREAEEKRRSRRTGGDEDRAVEQKQRSKCRL